MFIIDVQLLGFEYGCCILVHFGKSIHQVKECSGRILGVFKVTDRVLCKQRQFYVPLSAHISFVSGLALA